MRKRPLFLWFLWFRIYLLFFKFGAALHYALLAPLGERIIPIRLIGLIISIAAGIQMVFDVPAGRLLDKVGYKKLMLICTIVFIISWCLLFFGITWPSLISSIALGIFGRLFYSPWSNAYILSHADKGRSEKFMAYRDVATSMWVVLSCIALL